jgi:membrane fusion protein (multidrug efflux system)
MPAGKINWHTGFEIGWRGLIFVIAIAILVIGWQVTDDAYLQADITPIAAKVGGYIHDLPVQDFEHVHAGQVLAQIVEDDYRAAVVLARANVASARAQEDTLKAQRVLQLANIQAAHAAVASVAATLDQNGRDLARQQRLFQTGSSSAEAAEKLTTVRAQLLAQIAQSRAQADAAGSQLGVLGAQQEQVEATIAGQQANLEAAVLNLNYTKIVAPQDGVIGQRQVKPGQYVGIGSQITSLVPLPHLWVIANYKETQLTHMALGQKADIVVDTFPGHTLHGHVLAFAPASGSQFALLPPDNATGNFTKVVQRVAVKIAIDDSDGLAERLIPGMSVEAKIDARDGRH